MHVTIQVWPDDSATLLLNDGTSLSTYRSVEEAMAVCEQWLGQQVELSGSGLQDPSCASFY